MSGTLDDLMSSVDPALVVVTTAAEGVKAGCVVGFHSQSSMDPEHYCVWLSKANQTYRVSLRASHLAVHFLRVEDLEIAKHFGTTTGEDTDKFADIEFKLDEYGVPLLAACPNRLQLERIALLDDGSDHVCLTAKVWSAQSGEPFDPLRLSNAIGLEPGHENEERAVRPRSDCLPPADSGAPR